MRGYEEGHDRLGKRSEREDGITEVGKSNSCCRPGQKNGSFREQKAE